MGNKTTKILVFFLVLRFVLCPTTEMTSVIRKHKLKIVLLTCKLGYILIAANVDKFANYGKEFIFEISTSMEL